MAAEGGPLFSLCGTLLYSLPARGTLLPTLLCAGTRSRPLIPAWPLVQLALFSCPLTAIEKTHRILLLPSHYGRQAPSPVSADFPSVLSAAAAEWLNNLSSRHRSLTQQSLPSYRLAALVVPLLRRLFPSAVREADVRSPDSFLDRQVRYRRRVPLRRDRPPGSRSQSLLSLFHPLAVSF